MTPEKRIEHEILCFLKLMGFFVWKNESTGVYDPVRKTFRTNNNPHKIKGVSDILGIVDGGRLLAIEVKSPKGSTTREQREFIVNIQKEGGIAFVARSVEQVASQLAMCLPNHSRIQGYAKQYQLKVDMKEH